MKSLTPMMQQYLKIHEEVPDAFLLFRLGDFYELFFDDAIKASKILDLTLTGKDCGLDERAPMCGVPYHAVDNYIAKLVDGGYKVAVCEQTIDPSEAVGLVDRAIVRIITSGTVTDANSLSEDRNNYIMSVYGNRVAYGIVYCDVSTGETYAADIHGEHADDDFFSLLARTMPAEILVNTVIYQSDGIKETAENILKRNLLPMPRSAYDFNRCEAYVLEQLNGFSLSAVGLEDEDNIVKACGVLFSYLKETQKNALKHIDKITFENEKNRMKLDYATKRNLELTETLRGAVKKGSLLWVLDKTVTGVGARTLRKWVSEPLTDINEISRRLDVLTELTADVMLIEDLCSYLAKTSDIQRLNSKLSYNTANGRDMLAIKETLRQLPLIKKLLADSKASLLVSTRDEVDEMADIWELLEKSINEDCGISIKDGNVIKDGYDAKADELRSLKNNARGVLAQLEARERTDTGIKNLKIKYNKVFGYYIEVSNSNLGNVPDRYIRKQTLVNGERFYTEELKDIENRILNAQDELENVEQRLFGQINDKVLARIDSLKKNAEAIGFFDAECSLAKVSIKNKYVRAALNDEGIIDIKDGRHPVIEYFNEKQQFIANDVLLDNKDNRLALITGPNMAGKSTYIRQTALIVLMNQIGCFVPCGKADLCVVDRIFTRVGASDDLSAGQSTFMVEMSEVSNILKNVTDKSLVILDEVGRGTGTLDGLSIAWAVVEFLSGKNLAGCKTLFATHYHELTELASQNGIFNLHISIAQTPNGVVFLHKIMAGSSDRSYGIEVAKLAGLPAAVIERSEEILSGLEADEKNIKRNIARPRKRQVSEDISLFNYKQSNVINELKNLPVDEMTPIEAMNYLQAKKKELNNGNN